MAGICFGGGKRWSLPWRLRFRFEGILTRRCLRRRRRRSKDDAAKRAGCWPWLRFMTDRGAQRRRRSAASASDRAGLGAEVQRRWARWPDRPARRRATAAPDERAPRSAGRMVEDWPDPAVHGVVRWRIVDLCQWVWEEFRVIVSTADDEPGTARPWAIASSRRDRAIMRRPTPRSRILKKLPRRAWTQSRARRRRSRRDRNLVRRRGARRPEEQDHPALGQARNAPLRAAATSAPPRPTSSARSARKRARASAWSCPVATPRR